MSTPTSFNAKSFLIPNPDDTDWGAQVTAFLLELSAAALSKAGGNFQVVNDVNFGNLAGLIAKYFKSNSPNISQSGSIRLANGDFIAWRDGSNSTDLTLTINTDKLVFAGSELINVDSPQVIRNKNYAGTPQDFSVSFTLDVTSVWDVIYNSTNALLTQITLPSDSVVDIPIGSVLTVKQGNLGQVELIAGVGVTLENPFGTAKTRTRYATINAYKSAANIWTLAGDFASA